MTKIIRVRPAATIAAFLLIGCGGDSPDTAGDRNATANHSTGVTQITGQFHVNAAAGVVVDFDGYRVISHAGSPRCFGLLVGFQHAGQQERNLVLAMSMVNTSPVEERLMFSDAGDYSI